MKKLVLTVAASLACVAAFAQGKVSFQNDTLHLVYYNPDASQLKGADAALAGQGASSALMPQGVTLVADLYAGTSSTALTLHTSTSFAVGAGRFTTANYTDATLPGGTPAFFQVQIRDSAFANEAASLAGGSYGGHSIVFSTTPSSTLAFASIVNHAAPASSSWADGTFDMSTQSGLSGARGVIVVSAIPEPASFALAGLGIAAMAILRRRK